MRFWSLSRIGDLDFASPIGYIKVRECLPQVIEEVTADYTKQYAILTKSMKENGQNVPIRISRDATRIRDGIHRTAIATILGWKSMEVSTNYHENPWDQTEEGRRYWELWNRRIRGFYASQVQQQLS